MYNLKIRIENSTFDIGSSYNAQENLYCFI